MSSETSVNQRETPAPARDPGRDIATVRWVAIIAGLLGFLLSAATPLLPVVQTTANAELAAGRAARPTSPRRSSRRRRCR